jgi:hypothetical protein
MLDSQKKPKVFITPEEAEIYAIIFFSSVIKNKNVLE